MTAIEKARTMIANRSTENLINDFILTGTMNDQNVPTVRGWIMDELESRNQDAFAAWMDQDDPTDESLKTYFQ
jgi:hypothetical protein